MNFGWLGLAALALASGLALYFGGSDPAAAPASAPTAKPLAAAVDPSTRELLQGAQASVHRLDADVRQTARDAAQAADLGGQALGRVAPPDVRAAAAAARQQIERAPAQLQQAGQALVRGASEGLASTRAPHQADADTSPDPAGEGRIEVVEGPPGIRWYRSGPAPTPAPASH